MPASHMTEGDKLMRLWTHEVYRVFYDRLIDDKDRSQFFEIVKEMLQQFFKVNIDKLLSGLATSDKLVDDDIRSVNDFKYGLVYKDFYRSLFFGDYMVPGADPTIYDEITDFTNLTSSVERFVLYSTQVYTVHVYS